MRKLLIGALGLLVLILAGTLAVGLRTARVAEAAEENGPGGVPTTPRVAPMPPETLLGCEIRVVSALPPGAVRVGETTSFPQPENAPLTDDVARQAGCSVHANYAVRELSYVDTIGVLRWQIGFYRDHEMPAGRVPRPPENIENRIAPPNSSGPIPP